MTPASQPAALRVLLAPDCYGDSLTAAQAVAAIAAGWARARPADTLVSAPQSDGGPGFIDVLAGRIGEVRSARVSGPLYDAVTARWVQDSDTAYIECAQACGLALLGGPPTAATALAAHSRGVGQLLDSALSAGAKRIVVGLGGSACTDGGRAMVAALGGLNTATTQLAGVELIVASDVEYPLLGPMGAAAVFGPQKGADRRPSRRWRSSSTNGPGTWTRWPVGRSAPSRAPAQRAASARPCWPSGDGASRVPRSSPNTPVWALTSRPLTSSSPVRDGSMTSRCTAR